MRQVTHYLLVPDSSAARRVRRLLTEQSGQTGLIVGTWPELLEYARNTYLLPAEGNNWNECFHAALAQTKDAFWAESYLVSPQQTAVVVEEALRQIVSATNPGSDIDLSDIRSLPARAQKHLKDIVQCVSHLEGQLPGDLSIIRQLIAADLKTALQSIRVHYIEDIPALSRWQQALIEKLNNDAGVDSDEECDSILKKVLLKDEQYTERDDANCSLNVLQANLFETPDHKHSLDDTVQWVGVRDYLEEAEVAAGMVQTMLNQHEALRPADIGLLLPDSFGYSVAINDAFSMAGLALSGLPVEHWRCDLGCEALFHFLYCRRKPAPAMALAVCLSSPLMPWSQKEGAVLAQKVMDGKYQLKPFDSAGKEARTMLDLIRDGDDKPDNLIQAIQTFVSLLDGGEEFSGHIQRARSSVEGVCTLLKGTDEIDWPRLRRAVTPRTITTGESPDFNLEGVTVWRQGHEPWRTVRHLIVLGFSSGNYPIAPGALPVFSADDLIEIREQLHLPVDTPTDVLKSRRARFKRQLSAVSETTTFLVPRRNASGASQVPSESLVFMHQLFNTPVEPDELILDLDSTADRQQVRYLAEAEESQPENPREIIAKDIKFDSDLLALRQDADGNQKPESPSSLETLMISRLAWLLRRIDAEPLGWEPESPNIMLLGTLVHDVFEKLFQSGKSVPEKDAILAQAGSLLDDAIRRYGPFLRAAQWQVERQHLETGIIKAALAWREILLALNAEILGNEEWLQGNLNAVPLHGQADVVLGLPDKRLLVVDYKRSSTSSRKPRMDRGYDSQASLYRIMLDTGGPKDGENTELIKRIKDVQQIGIVYYLLNDQTSLSDSVLTESNQIHNWLAIENDVSSKAINLIKKRLAEVRTGRISLNREGDTTYFEKQAGVKPYALANSPLISLFTIPGETEEAE